jgi:hypothetical protein
MSTETGARASEPEKFTADDLNRWLDEFVEPPTNDPVESLSPWLSSPRGESFKRVVEIVYSFSAQKEESYPQTRDRLGDASRLFLNLLTTVTQTFLIADDVGRSMLSHQEWRKPEIWYHRDDLLYEFMSKGYNDEEDFGFRERWIASFAAALAERPWINSRYMEWVIVDSLVCNKVRQFGMAILGSEWHLNDVLFAGRAALDGKGMEAVAHGVARGIVIRRFLRVLLFFLLPLAGIWYGLRADDIIALIAGSVVAGMYLLWSVYVAARAEISGLLGRKPPKTVLESKIELWDLMHNAYRMLGGAVVDPTRIKRALEAAAEKGAVWEGAVYAILNRVIARDPAAWVTDDSHAYRRREASDISPAPEL